MKIQNIKITLFNETVKAKIHFGDHNQTFLEDSEFFLEADHIINHENYTDDAYNFDICLLHTAVDVIEASKIQGGPDIQIACLPEGPAEHGKACWVGGWGTTEWRGSTSDVLMSVGVNVFSDEYCRQHSLYGNSIQDDELCAGLPATNLTSLNSLGNHITTGGKDACKGDSGGPLICEVDGHAVLTGVVSWGVKCGLDGYPGIYAKVWHYKKWIKNKISTAITTTTKPTTTTTAATTTTTAGINYGALDVSRYFDSRYWYQVMGGNAEKYDYFHINASDFNNIFIGFSNGFTGHTDTKWEIVLGGWGGKQHVIRDRNRGPILAKKTNPNRFVHFIFVGVSKRAF